jgi:hypothetical protein
VSEVSNHCNATWWMIPKVCAQGLCRLKKISCTLLQMQQSDVEINTSASKLSVTTR